MLTGANDIVFVIVIAFAVTNQYWNLFGRQNRNAVNVVVEANVNGKKIQVGRQCVVEFGSDGNLLLAIKREQAAKGLSGNKRISKVPDDRNFVGNFAIFVTTKSNKLLRHFINKFVRLVTFQGKQRLG